MFDKLNEKDKKTLKKGSMAIALIAVLLIAMKGYGDWNSKSTEYKSIESSLKKLDIKDPAYNRMLNNVPVFKMPTNEQLQKEEFRDSLDQLFDGLRITTEPWQEVSLRSSAVPTLPGYNILKLKTSGNCRFDLILTLLAELKSNPYLVSVEELNIECDPQNPQMAKFTITLSTFTKIKRGK